MVSAVDNFEEVATDALSLLFMDILEVRGLVAFERPRAEGREGNGEEEAEEGESEGKGELGDDVVAVSSSRGVSLSFFEAARLILFSST